MDYYEQEMAKATAEIYKDVTLDVLSPTAISIGNNIGSLVDGVMGWLGCWGEKQKIKQVQYIEEYKQKIGSKISQIPESDLCDPGINVIGPAIDASKFFIENDYYKEMFSSLIAASCSKTLHDVAHPAFAEIIKQLSPKDATLLNMFNDDNVYPVVDLVERHSDALLTPYLQSLFDFGDRTSELDPIDQLMLTDSLDNLMRLGIVYKDDKILSTINYDEFKNHILYKAIEQAISPGSTLIMKKYRIGLTGFGRNFAKCCF